MHFLATRRSELGTLSGVKQMAWGLLLLCVVLGGITALRPSGRQQDFKRIKEED